MRAPAWEPVDASVTIVGEAEPVLQFATNRNMLAIISFSTPDTGVVAPLVDVGAGTAADYDKAVRRRQDRARRRAQSAASSPRRSRSAARSACSRTACRRTPSRRRTAFDSVRLDRVRLARRSRGACRSRAMRSIACAPRREGPGAMVRVRTAVEDVSVGRDDARRRGARQRRAVGALRAQRARAGAGHERQRVAASAT